MMSRAIRSRRRLLLLKMLLSEIVVDGICSVLLRVCLLGGDVVILFFLNFIYV